VSYNGDAPPWRIPDISRSESVILGGALKGTLEGRLKALADAIVVPGAIRDAGAVRAVLLEMLTLELAAEAAMTQRPLDDHRTRGALRDIMRQLQSAQFDFLNGRTEAAFTATLRGFARAQDILSTVPVLDLGPTAPLGMSLHVLRVR